MKTRNNIELGQVFIILYSSMMCMMGCTLALLLRHFGLSQTKYLSKKDVKTLSRSPSKRYLKKWLHCLLILSSDIPIYYHFSKNIAFLLLFDSLHSSELELLLIQILFLSIH